MITALPILIYVFLFTLFLFIFPNKSESPLRFQHKIPWLLPAFILFTQSFSPENLLFIAGLYAAEGPFALWLPISTFLGIGFVPLLFAPLWWSLKLKTDNQFILVRYSGKASRILFKFRAVYVGVFVAGLLLAFQIQAFSKTLTCFVGLEDKIAVLCSGGICLLLFYKNDFKVKAYTDWIHSLVIFVVFILLIYFALKSSGSGIQPELDEDKFDSAFYPNNSLDWIKWSIYCFVLWWSCTLFDGGGSQMQAFLTSKSLNGARNSLLMSSLLGTFFFSVVLGLIILLVKPGVAVNASEGEIYFLSALRNISPEYFQGIVLLAFFLMFIGVSESIISWGAAMLREDIRFLNGKKSNKSGDYFALLIITIVGILFALNADSIQTLVKFFLSIGAGVAPVFFLRWFWMRINAWAQLSAMISSCLYAILFDSVYDSYPNILIFSFSGCYEVKIVWVTILTTLTWLIVMFVSGKDDEKTLGIFRAITPKKKELVKIILASVLIGVCAVVLIVLSLHLLFSV
jgi:Na+/proline symporter